MPEPEKTLLRAIKDGRMKMTEEKETSEKKTIKKDELNMQILNEKLCYIQANLKAPKTQYNAFGKYSYRNCEDILEALKPLLEKTGCTLIISDDIVEIGDRYYVKATVKLEDEGSIVCSVCAFAREPLSRKGMDEAQITGATSSYARKYALNGLFLIDDAQDPDSTNKHGNETNNKSEEVPPESTGSKTGIRTDEIKLVDETNVLNFLIEEIAPNLDGGMIVDVKKLKNAIIEKYGKLPTQLKHGDIVLKYLIEDLGLETVSTKNDFLTGIK